MGKCTQCGKWNAEENDFCSACGQPLVHGNAPEAERAMEEARKQFERDALVSLDRDRITYVCEVCGTVNHIDNRVCSKCGKPRPRTELVTALRRLRESEAIKNEPAPAPKPEPAPVVPVPVVIEAEPEPVAEAAPEVQPEPQPEPQPEAQAQPLHLYRYVGGAFPGMQQNAPMVQPFVIVPYVNQFQPLYQYVPGGQLMRFEPSAPAPVQPPKAREEKKEEQPAPAPVADEKKPAKKQKGLWFANLVTLALSAAAILIVFLLPLLNGVGVRAPLWEGVPALLNAFGMDLNAGSYVIVDWTSYLAPAGLVFGLLFALILFLTSLIQMFRDRWTGASTAFGVLAFAGIAVGTMGMLQNLEIFKNGFDAFLNDARAGLWALWGVAAALVVVTAIVMATVNAHAKAAKKAADAGEKAPEAEAAEAPKAA